MFSLEYEHCVLFWTTTPLNERVHFTRISLAYTETFWFENYPTFGLLWPDLNQCCHRKSWYVLHATFVANCWKKRLKKDVNISISCFCVYNTNTSPNNVILHSTHSRANDIKQKRDVFNVIFGICSHGQHKRK